MLSLRFEKWELDAACQNTTWNFFAEIEEGDDGQGELEQNTCAQFCIRECPVRKECLSFALDNLHIDGVFGGTLPAERKILCGVDEFKEYTPYEVIAWCPLCSGPVWRPPMKDRPKVKRGFVWVECASGCGLGWPRMETEFLGIWRTPSKPRNGKISSMDIDEDDEYP